MSGASLLAQEIADIVAERLNKAAKKDLYTLDEAATFLSCSRDQVRNFMDDKKIPVVHIDSRPRFRIRDLERFVEQSKR